MGVLVIFFEGFVFSLIFEKIIGFNWGERIKEGEVF